MATIDSLANETLCKIMEMLKVPLYGWDIWFSTPQGRYDALRAAALVCTRWREPAQRALFDEIHLSYQNHLRGTALVASPARDRYPTRSLWGWSQNDVWSVARSCKGLQSLGVLGHITGHELQDVHLAGLKHLSCFILGGREMTLALPFRLSSLSICTSGQEESVQSPTITALVTASSQSLDTLNFQVPYDLYDPALSTIISIIAPRLDRLTIKADPITLQGDLVLVATFNSSEYFTLGRSKVQSDKGIDFSHLRAILDALPSPATLRRFSLSINSPAHLDSLILNDPALIIRNGLKIPTVTLAAAPDDPSVPVIMQACEARGIELVLDGQ